MLPIAGLVATELNRGDAGEADGCQPLNARLSMHSMRETAGSHVAHEINWTW